MDQNRTYDLIIVGAGPAGLSTGLNLVQMDPSWGNRMLILEKGTHPRPKLCGGGVTRSGLSLLKELDFKFPLPLPQEPVNHVLLQYQRRTIHVQGQPLFVVFHRPEFDHFLAKQAQARNIHLQENVTVLNLEHQSDCILIKTDRGQYQARVVVGADSARGPVRSWIRSQNSKRPEIGRMGRTLEILTPAKSGAPRFRDHSAILDFSSIRSNLQGYVWDFPSRVAGQPTHNRGIYDARVEPQRPRAQLQTLLQEGLIKFGGKPGEGQIKSTPIHWFSPKIDVSAPRVLLVGDAAGVDGLFGEGISPALAYGKVAAAEILNAFKFRDFSFKGYRKRLIRSPLGRYLSIRWLGSVHLYRFGKYRLFPHTLWTVGEFLARIWHAGPLE